VELPDAPIAVLETDWAVGFHDGVGFRPFAEDALQRLSRDPDREHLPGKDLDERELHRRRKHRIELFAQPSWVDVDSRPQGNRRGGSLSAVGLASAVDTGVVNAWVLVNDLLDEKAVDVPSRRADHVDFSVQLDEVTVGREAGHVAREEPAVVNRLLGQGMVVPVRVEDGLPANLEASKPIEAQTNNKYANATRTSANATIISTGISDGRSEIPWIFDGYEDEVERLAARVLRSVRHALSPRLLRL
jgi:hypothetical protein